MRLFLDANVLFTAAYSPQGVSRALMEAGRGRGDVLLTSHWAMAEAERNLLNKAPLALGAWPALRALLILVDEATAADIARARALPLVEKDAPILAAAWACAADMLVTGDVRDFGHLMEAGAHGLRVCTPRVALEGLGGPIHP